MKIIFLNIWGGRVKDQLISFLHYHTDVDVFCFQEVYFQGQGKDDIWQGAELDILKDLQNELTDYECFYHPHLGDWWGLAMFVKKHIAIIESGERFVHKQPGHNIKLEIMGHTAKNIQYVSTEIHGKPIMIINFHGLWNGQGKGDNNDRLVQSENIVAFLKEQKYPVVLGGDFNLSPDTESIKKITDFGMRNLIAEYGITSTRTSLYPKENKFADYVFTSPQLVIKDFIVLPDEISDHAPLLVDIEV